MGAACTECNSYEEDIFEEIIVSKQHFFATQNNPNMLQQIISISNTQLSHNLKNSHFYRKDPDTYYIGSIEDDSVLSYGLLYKPNKTLYCGQFFNGRFHGNGTLRILNHKIIFEGQFKDGRPQGNGSLQNQEQRFIFEGKWSNNNYPSSGKLKLLNNQKIEQLYFFDFNSAYVQIFYINGSLYKGFIDKETLLPEGMGKITYKSEQSYDGEWLNGKFHGSGIYTYKDGRVYNGKYFQGLKDGEGTLMLASGKYFVGIWKKGQRDGFGKLLQKDGRLVEKGIYRNNMFNHNETEQYLKNNLTNEVKEELTPQDLNEAK